MDFLRLLAFGYLLYGIVGLFGFQKIPAAHRDRPWAKTLYPLAGGVVDFDGTAVAGVFVLFFVWAVYCFFGKTDRASSVVVCADYPI